MPALPFPALYLYPLNHTFTPKHIALQQNEHVKIGRQTNSKTIPGERNGFFDSKVLSRQHAEIWLENGQIYIMDVKSSNGTFINGERLALESVESEPHVLKSDDIVEFGIDIVGEDNKTVLHHKVAARIICALTEKDAQDAARTEHIYQSQLSPNGTGTSPTAFNFGPPRRPMGLQQQQQQQPPQQPSQQQQQIMGGMAGSMRAPGRGALSFDHIVSRLQGELQKSRETGSELNSVNILMNTVQSTLSGALTASIPPYPHKIPLARPSPPEPPKQPTPPAVESESEPTLDSLRAQLRETQLSLANHVDKIRALEGVLADHEVLKEEVRLVREMMQGREHIESGEEEEEDDDDDDARSETTVAPHDLDRVEEEDEAQNQEEDEDGRRKRREELGRPRTPEPSGMGMHDDEPRYKPKRRSTLIASPSPSPRRSDSPVPQQPDDPIEVSAVSSPQIIQELTARLNTISNTLESAFELSRTLQAQHASAQSTISTLESKVSSLEALVLEHTSSPPTLSPIPTPPQPLERETIADMLADWKKGVEGQWTDVKEEWSQERVRLNKAREDWENKTKLIESNLGGVIARVDTGLASIVLMQQQAQNGNANNGAHLGLITPPSPRSLSVDSNKARHRRKRRSRSPRAGVPDDSDVDESTSSTLYSSSVPSSPGIKAEGSEEDVAERSLATPESYRRSSDATTLVNTLSTDSDQPTKEILQSRKTAAHPINASAAVGILVLSVAAAAVLWRVKE